ncbi:hypothetical protein K457DRAFT_386758 [Linnemannia elongata AG-77]|uniref:Uncharacterized protein n=1 Tax=Linnemannia elongata AG-77 TaxID=1314771 RepID=A0A197KI86_9FUNG|nr:hypothetical protein K457DRAFT_386758 [Linnemannia elongata AG-77]
MQHLKPGSSNLSLLPISHSYHTHPAYISYIINGEIAEIIIIIFNIIDNKNKTKECAKDIMWTPLLH